MQRRLPAHRPLRRRLDDVLPRAAPGGAASSSSALIRARRRRGRPDFDRLDDLLPGDDEHRRLRGRRRAPTSTTTSRKYYPELSKAMDLSNWGPVGTPDQIAAWLRTFAERGRGPLHLPLRRARPVRPGRALRERRPAAVHSRASEVSRMAERSSSCRTPSWWSMSACPSRTDDVVTIICDDEHREQAEAVAEVVVERGGWPVVMNNETQVAARPRGRALPDGPAAQPAPGDGRPRTR